MSKRRTRRYDLPKIDLNQVKLPNIKLPKADVFSRFKIPAVNIPWKQVIVVGGLAILAFTMLNLNTRMSEYSRLSSERDALKIQMEGLNATKSALQTQVAHAESDQAVFESAREGHLVREGEKLIVVLTPAGEQAVTAPQTGEEDIDVPEPWEIWMALFFGQ
jgi:cell division protein FtsB